MILHEDNHAEGLMMRVKINLDTMTDINDFVKIMAGYDGNVYLTDKDRAFVVSAKSMLGAIYSMEWGEVWCESDKDIYHLIAPFVAQE